MRHLEWKQIDRGFTRKKAYGRKGAQDLPREIPFEDMQGRGRTAVDCEREDLVFEPGAICIVQETTQVRTPNAARAPCGTEGCAVSQQPLRPVIAHERTGEPRKASPQIAETAPRNNGNGTQTCQRAKRAVHGRGHAHQIGMRLERRKRPVEIEGKEHTVPPERLKSMASLMAQNIPHDRYEEERRSYIATRARNRLRARVRAASMRMRPAQR
ncbi:MAG: hypothetical protein PeribacterD2_0821 [Candidatus Peribacter riflensis]|nr:MAG: hypothetical protein PeribacterD2_0821 [Candidatus Peribacter riflensis]